MGYNTQEKIPEGWRIVHIYQESDILDLRNHGVIKLIKGLGEDSGKRPPQGRSSLDLCQAEDQLKHFSH